MCPCIILTSGSTLYTKVVMFFYLGQDKGPLSSFMKSKHEPTSILKTPYLRTDSPSPTPYTVPVVVDEHVSNKYQDVPIQFPKTTVSPSKQPTTASPVVPPSNTLPAFQSSTMPDFQPSTILSSSKSTSSKGNYPGTYRLLYKLTTWEIANG